MTINMGWVCSECGRYIDDEDVPDTALFERSLCPDCMDDQQQNYRYHHQVAYACDHPDSAQHVSPPWTAHRPAWEG